MADQSPQVKRLALLQDKMESSHRVKAQAQLQAKIDNSTPAQREVSAAAGAMTPPDARMDSDR